MSQTYSCTCENGHTLALTATELEAVLEDPELSCERCGDPLELDDDITLVCQVCSEEFTAQTIEDAHGIIDCGCGSCEHRGLSGSIHVPGSRFYDIAAYEWHRDGRSAKKLRRPGRKDYWEGLIHFCQRSEFVSIFGERKIKGAPTGFYVHTKSSKAAAVCLTETPINECGELVKTHGKYGYVFRKKDIIGINGAPAIYLTEELIRLQERAGGFSSRLIPFINLLRIPSAHPGKTKIDYLHEREWRVGADIDLRVTVPFGVIIPGRSGYDKFRGPRWRTLLRAASRYEELDVGEPMRPLSSR